jgi:phosphatidate cytidylyltransferase
VSADTVASTQPEPPAPRGFHAPGFKENLGRRVVTALVLASAVIAVFFATPPWATVALAISALAVGLHEYFGLLRARGIRPMHRVGFLLAAALFLDVTWPGWLGVPCSPLGALLLLGFALWRGTDHESVSSAAATLLGAVYLGALGGTIASLRLLAPVEAGAWRMLMLVFIVGWSDVFAFFVGHAIGRRRLAPRVSPGKSVEGAIGGLVGGALGALAVRAMGLPALPVAHALGLGVVVAAAGVVGDLDESLLKRWAGVKDSGTIFPGHGGMLDRLDGLLFGAPVLYYYFQYVH